MFIQTLATASTAKSEPAGRIGYFGNFFNGLAKGHACFDQSGISLNLRTGPTGHAPLFNQ